VLLRSCAVQVQVQVQVLGCWQSQWQQ
jgi:hypothetical protein